jgi:hypothetical protein
MRRSEASPYQARKRGSEVIMHLSVRISQLNISSARNRANYYSFRGRHDAKHRGLLKLRHSLVLVTRHE